MYSLSFLMGFWFPQKLSVVLATYQAHAGSLWQIPHDWCIVQYGKGEGGRKKYPIKPLLNIKSQRTEDHQFKVFLSNEYTSGISGGNITKCHQKRCAVPLH